MVWSPLQYERFKSERREPFDDLLALVRPESSMRSIDLGCGTGELTAELHRSLSCSETLGIDSSPDMLERAHPLARDGLHFAERDIRELVSAWSVYPEQEPVKMPGLDGADPGHFDLVFSNAALQWIPDHHELLAAIRAGIVPGGQLAVQVPANFDDVSHTTAYELACEEPFRSAIAVSVQMVDRVDWVLPPEEYARLLRDLGAVEQHVSLHVYGHQLDSTLELVEWMKGTLLTPFASILGPATFEDFLTRYAHRLVESEGMQEPYYFTFKRILMWARF